MIDRYADIFAFLDMNPLAWRRDLRNHFGIDERGACEAQEAWMRTYEPELPARERAEIYWKAVQA
jgi:hypothetical protein